MSEIAAPSSQVIQPARTRSNVKGSTVLYYVVLVVLSLIVLVPILVMFGTSLKYQVDILSSKPQFIFTPTLANYDTIFTQYNFSRYLWNSILVGLGATILTLLSAGMAAYGLARMRFYGRGLMAQTTLIVRAVPPAVLAVPIFALWGLKSAFCHLAAHWFHQADPGGDGRGRDCRWRQPVPDILSDYAAADARWHCRGGYLCLPHRLE